MNSGNRKRAIFDIDRIRTKLKWLYLQYQLNTALYTLTTGEATVFNIIFISVAMLLTYSIYSFMMKFTTWIYFQLNRIE